MNVISFKIPWALAHTTVNYSKYHCFRISFEDKSSAKVTKGVGIYRAKKPTQNCCI